MSDRPSEFFHGTTHDIAGGYIVPANQSGKSQWGTQGYGGQMSSQHAFATESESIAWDFGTQAGAMKRSEAEHGYSDAPDRVRVHQVAPNPLMKPGVYHPAHPNYNTYEGGNLKEWVAPKFRSTGTIDIKPGHQGTFPSLNWHQFASKNLDWGQDVNHPHDQDIDEGHLMKSRPGEDFRRHSITGGNEIFDPTPEKKAGPRVTPGQLDLFSGKTAGWHAEKDESPVGDYHRNAVFGEL